MAAPVITARQTPAGQRMDDGYQSVVAIESAMTINFWEKGVTPPGIDGGEAVVTTTMHNSVWRTMNSSALRTLTPVTFRAAWDVDAYDEIVVIINEIKSITVYLPAPSGNRKITFYGFLNRFEPGELVEGTQPEASVTIVPTNYDPDNLVEEGPVVGT